VHRSAAPNLLVQFPLAELTLQLAIDPSKSRRSILARADGRSQQKPTVDPSKSRRLIPTWSSSHQAPLPSLTQRRQCRPALSAAPPDGAARCQCRATARPGNAFGRKGVAGPPLPRLNPLSSAQWKTGPQSPSGQPASNHFGPVARLHLFQILIFINGSRNSYELPKFIEIGINLRHMQTKFCYNPCENIYPEDLTALTFSQ
jgi:hypothetical protein